MAVEHRNSEFRLQSITAEPVQDGVDKECLVSILDDDYYFLDDAGKLSREPSIAVLYK
jgi:hypothetical protein